MERRSLRDLLTRIRMYAVRLRTRAARRAPVGEITAPSPVPSPSVVAADIEPATLVARIVLVIEATRIVLPTVARIGPANHIPPLHGAACTHAP